MDICATHPKVLLKLALLQAKLIIDNLYIRYALIPPFQLFPADYPVARMIPYIYYV